MNFISVSIVTVGRFVWHSLTHDGMWFRIQTLTPHAEIHMIPSKEKCAENLKWCFASICSQMVCKVEFGFYAHSVTGYACSEISYLMAPVTAEYIHILWNSTKPT